MTVMAVTEDNIRHMKGMEGLVLQGCGGSPEKWADRNNNELTENGYFFSAAIQKPGLQFKNVNMEETAYGT